MYITCTACTIQSVRCFDRMALGFVRRENARLQFARQLCFVLNFVSRRVHIGLPIAMANSSHTKVGTARNNLSTNHANYEIQNDHSLKRLCIHLILFDLIWFFFSYGELHWNSFSGMPRVKQKSLHAISSRFDYGFFFYHIRIYS